MPTDALDLGTVRSASCACVCVYLTDRAQWPGCAIRLDMDRGESPGQQLSPKRVQRHHVFKFRPGATGVSSDTDKGLESTYPPPPPSFCASTSSRRKRIKKQYLCQCKTFAERLNPHPQCCAALCRICQLQLPPTLRHLSKRQVGWGGTSLGLPHPGIPSTLQRRTLGVGMQTRALGTDALWVWAIAPTPQD